MNYLTTILYSLPYVKEGGWLVAIIYLFSLLATAVFIERVWILRKKNILSYDLWNRIKGLLDEKKWHDIEKILASGKTPMEKLAFTVIINRDSDIDILKELVEDQGKIEREKLERGFGFLSLTISVSPLLGLLGTVSGMIRVFSTISQESLGNPKVLASGISEALLTTFTGLSVAIITLIFYSYLSSKAKSLSRDLESFSLKLMDTIKKK